MSSIFKSHGQGLVANPLDFGDANQIQVCILSVYTFNLTRSRGCENLTSLTWLDQTDFVSSGPCGDKIQAQDISGIRTKTN